MKRCLLSLGLAVASAAVVSRVSASTVAYWRFEPGALNIDSGPNNYNLTIAGNGVSGGTPTTGYNVSNNGSITLSGTSTAGRQLQTINPLNLSSLNQITVEWWANVATNASAGIIFEQGSDFNTTPGAIIADVIEGPSRMDAAQHSNFYYIERANRPANGTWAHYAMTIDKALAGAARIHLYINGVDVGDNTTTGADANDKPAFGNATMYFGSRNNSNFFFDGSIDEVRISDTILSTDQFLIYVPEPASAGVFAASGALLAISRRRRAAPNQ